MTSSDHAVALINAFTVPVGESTPLLDRCATVPALVLVMASWAGRFAVGGPVGVALRRAAALR